MDKPIAEYLKNMNKPILKKMDKTELIRIPEEVKVWSVDNYRSQGKVNTAYDMVRVVITMPLRVWHNIHKYFHVDVKGRLINSKMSKVIDSLVDNADYSDNVREILEIYFTNNHKAYKAWEDWFNK